MTKTPDIIPLAEFNFALLNADTYTRIKNRMSTTKGTKYSTKKFQASLNYWVSVEQIRKIETTGTYPKYNASLTHGTEPISEFFDTVIKNSLSNLNENYDNLKSKKLFGKDQSHFIFDRIDEIISTIEYAQWSYFATKNFHNEKELLDKTITKGRKGLIKFCKKILVGKSDKEIGLIVDLCKKYPFTVF